MPGYEEIRVDVHGVDTLVQVAGTGEPLVFLHGAGTVTGFDALLPLAERYRLIVPHHPGYGGSADDPRIDCMEDYLHHYLDLFDALGIGRFALVGQSMGGWMAARFAIDHPERVARLVLVAPIGLKVPEHPTVDLFMVRDEEVPAYLAADLSVFAGKVPDPMTAQFLADRYREATSTARLTWQRPYDRKLARWLHRLTVPTLLLWGEADRLVPVGQAAVWASLIPRATIRVFEGQVGHLLLDECGEAVDAIGDFAAAGQPQSVS